MRGHQAPCPALTCCTACNKGGWGEGQCHMGAVAAASSPPDRQYSKSCTREGQQIWHHRCVLGHVFPPCSVREKMNNARPILPCWCSNLGDVAALGLHSAGTGDPSPPASGDTKRHYNDGGGIKQVGEAQLPLGGASFRPTLKPHGPTCPQDSCLTCHTHRGQAEGLIWDETLQHHPACASWQSDISGWSFTQTASHPIKGETLVCFAGGWI